MAKYVVSAENVSFQYKETDFRALKRINLDLKPGKMVLLCGPTGSGKTSLIRSINGLIPHFYHGKFYGYMKVNEKDTVEENGPAKISRYVGTVFQNPENQLFTMNVERELTFALENLGFKREKIKHRLTEAFRMIDLRGIMHKAPYELSGGEQQKVAIASILALNPDILVFDEPLSNLDPKTAHEIVQILKKLQKEYGKTLIISEHRIEYVIHLLDEIILIENGEIILHENAENAINQALFYQKDLDIPPLLYWLFGKKKEGYFEEDIPLALEDQKRLFQKVIHRCVEEPKEKQKGNLEKEKKPERFGNISQESMVDNSSKRPEISFHGVNFSYESKIHNNDLAEKVLDDVSFSIQKGEIIGIIGKNGAGKSTLIKCILGLLTPQTGNIKIQGKDSIGKPVYELAKKIGLMFQNPEHQLFLNSIMEEMEFSLKSLKLEAQEAQKRIEKTLHQLDLSSLKDRSPFHISGGQKKKASLATILCRDPDILIFDEPTIGQDRKQKGMLSDLILESKKQGRTTIIVSHDMTFLADLVDRLLVLHQNHIYTEGTPEEIFNDVHVLNVASLRPLEGNELIKTIKDKDLPKDVCTIKKLQYWLEKREGEN